MNLTILIPAHNEEDVLEAAVRSLMIQTFHWNRLVVVADNCTDSTVGLAESLGCDVFQTVGNIHMKAGALNQALAHILPSLEDEDMVFVMDADGVLDPHFLENAAERLMNERLLGAVGGNFDGMSGGGVVGYLQRNEYSRYKRDTRRLRGKCLVVTGTAALFKVDTLRNVSHARLAGVLPVGDSKGGVYDTSVLTEDNELSFALLHLGYKILSPADCVLLTEVMPTWKKLWNQRLRWKRGAIENCFQYGFTKVTWRYLVDYFRKNNVFNIKWVFNPTTDVYAGTTDVHNIYPGSDYVDVLGLDGYNWGNGSPFVWQEFKTIFSSQYARLTALNPTAPVWVCETGCKEPTVNDGAPIDVSHSKGSWVAGMFRDIPIYFPRIDTVCWFNETKERHWTVNSSTDSLTAIKAHLAS